MKNNRAATRSAHRSGDWLDGDGGLGTGGAVFVQQGASLTINGGDLLDNAVTGAGGGTDLSAATPSQSNGSAFGGSIFLQGTQILFDEPMVTARPTAA